MEPASQEILLFLVRTSCSTSISQLDDLYVYKYLAIIPTMTSQEEVGALFSTWPVPPSWATSQMVSLIVRKPARI